jgi:hypothetical protein
MSEYACYMYVAVGGREHVVRSRLYLLRFRYYLLSSQLTSFLISCQGQAIAHLSIIATAPVTPESSSRVEHIHKLVIPKIVDSVSPPTPVSTSEAGEAVSRRLPPSRQTICGPWDPRLRLGEVPRYREVRLYDPCARVSRVFPGSPRCF